MKFVFTFTLRVDGKLGPMITITADTEHELITKVLDSLGVKRGDEVKT